MIFKITITNFDIETWNKLYEKSKDFDCGYELKRIGKKVIIYNCLFNEVSLYDFIISRKCIKCFCKITDSPEGDSLLKEFLTLLALIDDDFKLLINKIKQLELI